MFTHGRIRVVALLIADALCVCSVWTAAVYGYWLLGRAMGLAGLETSIGSYNPSDYLVFWPVPILFLLVNSIFELYHGNWMYPAAPLPPVEEMRRLFGSALLTHVGLIAFLAFAYQTTEGFSRAVMAFSGITIAFAAQSFRNWVRRLLFRTGIGQIPVLLAGNGEVAAEIAVMLDGDAYSGFRIAGYFDDLGECNDNGKDKLRQQDAHLKVKLPRLGSLCDVVAEAKKRDIKILLACYDERMFRMQLEEFSSWFMYIEYLPTSKAFPVIGSRAVCFGGIGGFEMTNQGRMKAKRVQKRILDMVLSLFAFIALSPLFVILPVLIKLTSPGPVFYRQRRLGRNGTPIRIWKFRSMHEDAESRLADLLARDPDAAAEWARHFKLDRDPRVTPIGRFLRKTSLDEIPQLFNVFSGEMALIGPRPIVEEEIGYYGASYRVFSSVRPGVTGLWQVSGRSDTDYARRVALDSYYVLNWSPWMDLWILVRTVYAVLFMRGAR